MDLSPLSEPGRHHGHQGPQAPHRAAHANAKGPTTANVKTGHGGIRDIEFVIQFLQLLNGGDLPRSAHRQHAGGDRPAGRRRLPDAPRANDPGRQLQLPAQDRASPADHVRPANAHAAARRRTSCAQLAIRMGYGDAAAARGPGRASRPTTSSKTELNRKILDHLLHDAFGDDDADRSRKSIWCSTPIRRPSGSPKCWAAIRFATSTQAYQNLMALVDREDSLSVDAPLPALSGRHRPAVAEGDRRHARSRLDARQPEQGQRFARRQGSAVGAVQLQSADAAAVRRAVLVQPVSVGHSDQQSGHDRRADGQPGAGQAADARSLGRECWPSCAAAAEDLDPILHSFKNAQQLRVGVRDILGKEESTPRPARCPTSPRPACGGSRSREYREADRQAGRAD